MAEQPTTPAVDETSIQPIERRDSLEKHLQTRPEAQDLKNRHILLDTTAAPALQKQQAELERQRITVGGITIGAGTDEADMSRTTSRKGFPSARRRMSLLSVSLPNLHAILSHCGPRNSPLMWSYQQHRWRGTVIDVTRADTLTIRQHPLQ